MRGLPYPSRRPSSNTITQQSVEHNCGCHRSKLLVGAARRHSQQAHADPKHPPTFHFVRFCQGQPRVHASRLPRNNITCSLVTLVKRMRSRAPQADGVVRVRNVLSQRPRYRVEPPWGGRNVTARPELGCRDSQRDLHGAIRKREATTIRKHAPSSAK